MGFDPGRAARRFGTGLGPRVEPPVSVDEMLARLADPDLMAQRYPIPGVGAMTPTATDIRAANRTRRDARGTDQEEAATAALRQIREQAATAQRASAMATFARAIAAPDGLRERLTGFWADHFTVRSRVGPTRHLVTSYVEDAIRPHVAGRFSDMLWAVATHPMMLVYLDQVRSMGPGSVQGQRRGRGLNENFARELIELHTLGVGGSYTQTDVRELAELLTGLTLDRQNAFIFHPGYAEPGAETVLGQAYGGEPPELSDIRAVLTDLARHTQTARHLAQKLAVHFLSDAPSEALVETIASAWQDSDGDLLVVTEAMLRHPDAWDPEPRKVMQPQQFVAASLRALGVDADAVAVMDRKTVRDIFHHPLRAMGQEWEAPPGPNGWPEAAEAWITPQGMSARITWAMGAPRRLLAQLPDPRAFAETALGPDLPEAVRFAASAAESVTEGIGVVLASAAFQRR